MSGYSFLDVLEGSWRLRRVVSSGFAMEGTAHFIRAKDHVLRYVEQGQILETGTSFTRAYEYVMKPEGLTLLYADGPYAGNLFLQFPGLREPSFPQTAKADHICGADRYAAEFNFSSRNEFTTRYDITGPKKNHSIVTDYTRTGMSPPAP